MSPISVVVAQGVRWRMDHRGAWGLCRVLKTPAGLLHHVSTNPAGARSLRRHSRAGSERNIWTSSPGWNGTRIVFHRLLNGLEGKLTTSKSRKLAKCSRDTGLRDNWTLLERRILAHNPAGWRSTSYELAPRKSRPRSAGLSSAFISSMKIRRDRPFCELSPAGPE